MQFNFDRIYLVAKQPSTHGKFDITHRKRGVRPKNLQFFGSRPDGKGETMGVLILDQKWWDETFANEEDFLPGRDTPEGAAESIVKANSNISYGCPLCEASFPTLEESRTHIEGELTSFLEMFVVDEELQLVCPICGKEYASKGHYENHVRSHMPE